MYKKFLLAVALATAVLSTPLARADDAPLQIGITIWPGWMPWWIVEERDFSIRLVSRQNS